MSKGMKGEDERKRQRKRKIKREGDTGEYEALLDRLLIKRHDSVAAK